MDNLDQHIRNLREDFMRGVLSEQDVNESPFVQFEAWLQQALDAGIPEAQAMNLATVSPDGRPSSRIVYLRELHDNRFSFYTNYESQKARQLEKNNAAALTFFWPGLERQVRIEGLVSKADAEQSDAYYNARPYASKIGAWASPQSRPLASRAALEDQVNAFEAKFSSEAITRPPFWGGFVLRAQYYEFWQGRKSRLHDRICYTAQENNWKISRIAP